MTYRKREPISDQRRRQIWQYERWNRRIIAENAAMKRDMEREAKDEIQAPETDEEADRGEQIQPPLAGITGGTGSES